jgi:hypothetical protein
MSKVPAGTTTLSTDTLLVQPWGAADQPSGHDDAGPAQAPLAAV